MIGIEPTFYKQLHAVLLRCPQFESHSNLKAIFVDRRIALWAALIPEADNLSERVQTVIETFSQKTNGTGQNGLLLLLHVLQDNTHPQSGLHRELNQLITTLPSQVSPSQPQPVTPTPPSNNSRSRQPTVIALVAITIIALIAVALSAIVRPIYAPAPVPTAPPALSATPLSTAIATAAPRQQRMFVLDYRDTPSLNVFTMEGVFIQRVLSGEAAELDEPAALAFGPDNNIFIGNFNSAFIAKYATHPWRFRTSIYYDGMAGDMEELTELHYDNRRLYALSNDTEIFVIINPEAESPERVVERVVSHHCLRYPTALTTASAGDFYIGNAGGTVCIFSALGTFVGALTVNQRVDGIALDADDNIFISDYVQGKIFRYNEKRAALIEFAQVEQPSDLRFHADGQLYAVTAHGVERWAANGDYLGLVVQNGEQVTQVRTFEFEPIDGVN